MLRIGRRSMGLCSVQTCADFGHHHSLSLLSPSLSLSSSLYIGRSIEKANLLELAKQKAQFVSEHFARVQESTLQLQAFGREVILEDEDIMLVDSYLASFSGLQQSVESYDHSVW